MLHAIITFTDIKAEFEVLRKEPLPETADGHIDWDKYETEYRPRVNKVRDKAESRMKLLEETAFALSMERIRRKSGYEGYYSDHIGLSPDADDGTFKIEAWLLYPELIVALEELQGLCGFELRFETGKGNGVPMDWWQDEDELELYNPHRTAGATNYCYDAKIEEAEAKADGKPSEHAA